MERIKRRRLDAQAWRGVLERFGASGLTVQAFCHGESINDASFYRWRARLGSAADGGLVPRPAVPLDVAAARFVDLGPLVQNRACTARLNLKLDLGDGLMLHLVRG